MHHHMGVRGDGELRDDTASDRGKRGTISNRCYSRRTAGLRTRLRSAIGVARSDGGLHRLLLERVQSIRSMGAAHGGRPPSGWRIIWLVGNPLVAENPTPPSGK